VKAAPNPPRENRPVRMNNAIAGRRLYGGGRVIREAYDG
jgi:hypothetical protein